MKVTQLIETKTLCNIPNHQNLGKPLLRDINQGIRQPAVLNLKSQEKESCIEAEILKMISN